MQYYFIDNEQDKLNLNKQKSISQLKRKRLNVLEYIKKYNQIIRKQVLTKKKNKKLEQILNSAGVALKPEEYIIFQWLATALGGGVLYLFSGRIFLLISGGVIGYLFPKYWLKTKQQKRILQFNEGLPDMMTTMVGALRAGFSFAQALKTVVEEAESPIKEEINMVLKEMQYGSSIEEALYHLKDRMPSGDLELMVEAVLIQRQVGGNLASILETIVQTIRDRNRIQRQVRTLTAQGRLSGTVIGMLPIVLGFFIYLINPSYIMLLFTHPIGITMITTSVISGIIGFALIRKLTTIEV